MLDFGMLAGFLLHSLGLFGLAFWFCRRLRLPRQDWPFVIGIALWSALVLTGYGAGVGNNLGQLSVYVPLSFVALGCLLAVWGWLFKKTVPAPLGPKVELSFDSPDSPQIRRFLFWFMLGTLGLFALVQIALGLGIYPDNADSIIYRLPRAFWYVSNGSFLHPFPSIDKRLVFYPLDGVALYIPFVLYGLPGTFHCLPSLIAWSAVLYVTYRFSRALGADKLLALGAAWLVGLTPSILAQAISTNDEILAAAAFVSGLFLFWRWMETGRSFYFVLAGMAVALSAGTKLHIVFLLPMIALAAGIGLFHALREKGVFARVWKAIGWPSFLATIALMGLLFLPFLFYNYASIGRFYFFDDFKDQVFNVSGKTQIGAQNFLIYLSQMVLSPIADLNFWPDTPTRQHFNTALNKIFNPLIRPFIVNDPSFFHLGYRFTGVTLPVSVRFVEFSLWAAFVWLLWPWQAFLALRQKTPWRGVFFVLALTPFLWLILWSLSTLYMEGTATYFTFYIICAAPAMVLAFGAIKNPFLRELRWVFVILVGLTNTLVSHNLVMYSGFRALPDLIHAPSLPYDWLHFDPKITQEIQKAERLRIVFTHEKMPYFAYMHRNPRATFLSPYSDGNLIAAQDYDRTLQIFPISALPLFGFMPVNIPDKTKPGLTFLGLIRAIGREAVFAVGNGVEKRYPENSHYIIFQARFLPNTKTKQLELSINREVLGLSSQDHLSFTYLVKKGDQIIAQKEKSQDPSFSMPLKETLTSLSMTIIVTQSWSGKELARATYPLGGTKGWLQESGEYY